MNRNKSILAAIVTVVLLVVARVAFAGAVETHNATLQALPTSVAAQTSATAAQSVVWSATPIDPRATKGNPKLIVEGNFQTADATCVVTVGRYFYNRSTGVYTLLGVKSGTLTASASGGATDAGLGSAKRYLALAALEFDTLGATHVDIRMAAPSSGSVTLTHYMGFSNSSDGL